MSQKGQLDVQLLILQESKCIAMCFYLHPESQGCNWLRTNQTRKMGVWKIKHLNVGKKIISSLHHN